MSRATDGTPVETPDLARVAAWSELPAAIRVGVLAMVDAAAE